MPVYLPALNRRQALLATGAGLVACAGAAGRGADDNLVYIVNDTHIGEKHPADSAVPTHLRMVVSQLLALKRKPACVLINGDLALKDGQRGDYVHFARLIAPLQKANIDVHVTLGNHDNREAFYSVLKEQRRKNPLVASRHITIVKTPQANFFLLDTLTRTMVTQGTVGEAQRAWLAKALDAHASKPAVIVAHHNPRLGGDPLHFPGGLIDSQQLWEVLAARKHVKAYVHGHIHDRGVAEHRGIHIINTPATSYVGDPTRSTTGWTTARLAAEGVALTTHTTDPMHKWNGAVTKLKWLARS